MFCQDMFNQDRSQNPTRIYPWRLEREIDFDVGVYESSSEDERLPNKSIKELRLKIRSWQS